VTIAKDIITKSKIEEVTGRAKAKANQWPKQYGHCSTCKGRIFLNGLKMTLLVIVIEIAATAAEAKNK